MDVHKISLDSPKEFILAAMNIGVQEEKEISSRRTICDSCEFKKGLRCTKCGCFIKYKTKRKNQKCPVGKW